MKKLVLVLSVAFLMSADADIFLGLEEKNHLSGAQVTEDQLRGKAVLVYGCGASISAKSLVSQRAERIAKIAASYDKNRFFCIGIATDKNEAETQKFIAANKIKFPVYKSEVRIKDGEQKVNVASEAVYFFDHRGKLARSIVHGGDFNEFEVAMVEEVTKVGMPPDLLPGMTLVKYKSLKNKIKLGANMAGVIKSLEKDVKAAEKKTATKVQKDKADEASQILSAIQEGKRIVAEDIAAATDYDPVEAKKLVTLYMKSFPAEAAEFKEKLVVIDEKIKEMKAAKSAPKAK